MRVIVLDSSPLGLLVHRKKIQQTDECHAWFQRHVEAGIRIKIPAIVVYELRRELLLGHKRSLRLLDELCNAEPDRYLKLDDKHLRSAAQLWADVRRKGRPASDRHALDVDVILAAQVLSLGLPADELVVATSNVSHFFDLVPAREWQQIE